MMTRDLFYFDEYIQANLVEEECGIELDRIGPRTFLKKYPVSKSNGFKVELNDKRKDLKRIEDFVRSFRSSEFDKPFWFKINVIDQAINEYVGMGFLNIEQRFDWMSFVTNYLDNDRADQGGDTLIIIFDPRFAWAVCFTLSTDYSYFSVEKFEKLD